MCKAMNRSFTNVLFGAFGQVQAGAGRRRGRRPYKSGDRRRTRPQMLEQADLRRDHPRLRHGGRPGAAQGARAVRPARRSAASTCKFAIHPVAGRMPGHMNVLLAEADIPVRPSSSRWTTSTPTCRRPTSRSSSAPTTSSTRPRAHDKTSPIYGMPIIDADKAQTVFAIKRSMNPGFAGIDNELYFADNTLMLFGDAKQVIGDLVKAVAGEGVAAAH